MEGALKTFTQRAVLYNIYCRNVVHLSIVMTLNETLFINYQKHIKTIYSFNYSNMIEISVATIFCDRFLNFASVETTSVSLSGKKNNNFTQLDWDLDVGKGTPSLVQEWPVIFFISLYFMLQKLHLFAGETCTKWKWMVSSLNVLICHVADSEHERQKIEKCVLWKKRKKAIFCYHAGWNT